MMIYLNNNSKALFDKINKIPQEIWFYDFEVFKKYWCVTFYNLKTKIWRFFDDANLLKNFYYNELSGFLTGFNNTRYDNYVFKAILLNINPWLVSDWIINQKKQGWQYSQINNCELKTYAVDTMDLLGGNRISLKTYEAFLGFDIKKCSLNFDYDGFFNVEQIAELKSYNRHDVKCCCYLFCQFIDQFLIKLQLIIDYQLPKKTISKTLSKITSLIFKANKFLVNKYKNYQLNLPQKIKAIYQNYLPDYYWIINKFENVNYLTQLDSNYQKEQIRFSVKTKDYNINCASGGAHGSKNNYISQNKELIVVADYFSNYPNLIVNYDLGSRACLNMPQLMSQLLNERIVSKKNNDYLKNAYLKTLLVMPFGAMDYIYNDLWDPKIRQSICVCGQLLIIPIQLILSKKFGTKITFLQINTDGLIFKVNDQNTLKLVYQFLINWSKIVNMKIETNLYTRIYQKDVNNYILIDDKNCSKNWKVKGKFVKYYHNQFHHFNFNQTQGSLNNVLTVIDEAVVNFLVNQIPLIQTIKNCQDLIKFQYVFQLRGKYENLMIGDKVLQNLKTCRVFFTKTGNPLFKIYHNENQELKKEKIALTSERNLILNEDVRKIKVQEVDLDFEYYEKLAKEVVFSYTKPNNKELLKNIGIYPGEFSECGLCSKSLLDEKTVRILYEKEVCKTCYTSN